MAILDLPKLLRRYQLTGQTWLIDIYALLPQNLSFRFWRSHIYFIRYCNSPTEITRNHFCDVFSKNQKYLRKISLRRLIEVTEKTSFLRYSRDASKTSHKRHLFWDVFERSLRYLSQWRSDRSLRDISCQLGWTLALKKWAERPWTMFQCIYYWLWTGIYYLGDNVFTWTFCHTTVCFYSSIILLFIHIYMFSSLVLSDFGMFIKK